jgi:hypothetical protein
MNIGSCAHLAHLAEMGPNSDYTSFQLCILGAIKIHTILQLSRTRIKHHHCLNLEALVPALALQQLEVLIYNNICQRNRHNISVGIKLHCAGSTSSQSQHPRQAPAFVALKPFKQQGIHQLLFSLSVLGAGIGQPSQELIRATASQKAWLQKLLSRHVGRVSQEG